MSFRPASRALIADTDWFAGEKPAPTVEAVPVHHRRASMTLAGDFTNLTGRAVLVVEDDYFMAEEMAEAVRKVGATVLGPVPDVDGAMAIIAERQVDAAVLDINLGDETSFPVAQALKAKGVRVVFVSGYDDWFVPTDLDEVPIYRKPTDPNNVVRILFGSRNDAGVNEGD